MKEAHPKFKEILTLREIFGPTIQTEIDIKLENAHYDDIDQISTYYREKFFIEGLEEKITIGEQVEEKPVKSKQFDDLQRSANMCKWYFD
ncbi:MAG: hypothetical protein ACXAD7_08885 [Candidatus Kariarchaeaceae archaeon]|jgi:hypothetical protein